MNTYDAIVVGSGVSGGWAAKELTEKGLKTLLLEKGRKLEHIKDYTTAFSESWQMPHRGRLDNQDVLDYHIGVRTRYAVTEESKHLFIKDSENPYQETRKFTWIRGNQTGGKSLTWGRQVYRWSDQDFEANAKEGIAIDWPLRYKDLEPWYAYVEKFVGVSGSKENWADLPDSVFQPAMEMNCVEREFTKKVRENLGIRSTIGRVAHLTAPTQEQKDLGRTSCQYRNRCIRGCPYGSYFSTQSATLPAAVRTGNLTLLNNKIVFEVIFDDTKGKATGVRVIDQETKKVEEYFAKIIFLNASAVASAWIMMQSLSKTHPNGLGNESGHLGRNLMDHHKSQRISGEFEGYQDMYYYGKRPNGLYIPRFVNRGKDKRDFLRGFGYQGSAARGITNSGDTFGADLKQNYTHLGNWNFSMMAFGETLPSEKNRFTLSKKLDKFGLPQVDFDAAWGENELKMRPAMVEEGIKMLETAGLKNIKSFATQESMPGISIHEMGTARMGHEPKTSVLNKHNQVWGANNVFVTDGASFASSSCVNPSLTYMALTARAVDYAVSELKKGNLT